MSQALGVIVMQKLLRRTLPALTERDARAVLNTIEQTGLYRRLAEMLLLRACCATTTNAAALAPQPTLRDPALLAQLAAAGLKADLIDGSSARSRPASNCPHTASFRKPSRTR